MTSPLPDSGKRVRFETGMIRDVQDDKPRFELCVPIDQPYEEQMLTRFAIHMARGAEKYSARNWEQAGTEEELERYYASLLRHVYQLLAGDQDEDHAAAIYFNVMGAEYVKCRLREKAVAVAVWDSWGDSSWETDDDE